MNVRIFIPLGLCCAVVAWLLWGNRQESADPADRGPVIQAADATSEAPALGQAALPTVEQRSGQGRENDDLRESRKGGQHGPPARAESVHALETRIRDLNYRREYGAAIAAASEAIDGSDTGPSAVLLDVRGTALLAAGYPSKAVLDYRAALRAENAPQYQAKLVVAMCFDLEQSRDQIAEEYSRLDRLVQSSPLGFSGEVGESVFLGMLLAQTRLGISTSSLADLYPEATAHYESTRDCVTKRTKTGSVRFPIRVGDWLIAGVAIGHHEYDLLVDTGCSLTSLRSSLAGRLDSRGLKRTPILTSYGETISGVWHAAPKIYLDNKLESLGDGMVTMPHDDLGRIAPLHGILGMSHLERLCLTVDYAERYFELSGSPPSETWDHEFDLKRGAAGTYQVFGRVNGIPEWLRVDTGAEPFGTCDLVSVGAKKSPTDAILKVLLGGIESRGKFVQSGLAALGQGFLRQFKFCCDFPRGKLYVARTARR